MAMAIECIPSFKYWSLSDALMEFRGLIGAQMDMSKEAENLKRLRRNFKDDPRVLFPEPILAHSDVLVEEFMHGEPISSFINRHEHEGLTDIKRHLAATSLQTFLTMLLHHNFAHGDLHPGNVLVTSVNDKDGPKLVFLDAGICSTLTPTSRDAFLKIFLQAVQGDGRAVS